MIKDLIRKSVPVRRARLTVPAVAVAAMCTAGSAVAAAQPGAPAVLQWPMAGQSIGDDHFQPAGQAISPANAGSLAPEWTLTTAGAISATPTVYDGAAYVPDTGGELWAASASDGRVLWSRSIASYTGVPGDLSRTSPAVYGSELILGDWPFFSATARATVFAVDRYTGRLMWSTAVDSSPASLITGSPVVAGGVVYVGVSSKEETLAAEPGYPCCTFRGAVAALSATTGQILWKTYTVPSNNSGGDTNSPGFYSGGAVWGSTPVVDPARGLLYVGTGNNYTVPPGVCTAPGQTGCVQPASGDYADSILALHLRTGAVAWADHTLSSDVWTIARPAGPDFDFGSGPNLFTTTNPATGQPEQLLGIGQKSGVYWAVAPATGKVVWQTKVGPGGASGGILWGSAADGDRIYVAEADAAGQPYTLGGSGPAAGQTVTGGSWAALAAATGKILWQAPDPQGAADTGFVTAANGVVYAGSSAATGTNMYALAARTGTILWSFASGGSVSGGAAVVAGAVYWGSGYCGGPCQQSGQPPVNNNQLYAFTPR
jgi:polyvinyl alcohol dehydrogenase (cytochrome)